MDNQHIPIPGGEDLANGLSTIHEEAGTNSGSSYRHCGKSILLLLALAVACIILVLSPASTSDILPFAMAFPFAQVGHGLRALSLPGGVGNVIAILIYVAFCLLPMAALPLIRKKRAKDALQPVICTEDALLLVISTVLFFAMYFIINPGVTRVVAIAAPLEQALMGGIIYSLLIAFGVIRLLRRFNAATTRGLGKYIGIMLHALNVLFVFVAFGLTFAQMLDAFEALRSGNTVPGQQLGVTYVFLALRHIVNALPYVLNIWVVFMVKRLLAALNTDPYSQETLQVAKGVSRVCAVALTASVLALAGFNLLQLIFISRLYVVNSNINFPVASVLFVLGALLLTRYIAENKLLKDENDQFV